MAVCFLFLEYGLQTPLYQWQYAAGMYAAYTVCTQLIGLKPVSVQICAACKMWLHGWYICKHVVVELCLKLIGLI